MRNSTKTIRSQNGGDNRLTSRSLMMVAGAVTLLAVSLIFNGVLAHDPLVKHALTPLLAPAISAGIAVRRSMVNEVPHADTDRETAAAQSGTTQVVSFQDYLRRSQQRLAGALPRARAVRIALIPLDRTASAVVSVPPLPLEVPKRLMGAIARINVRSGHQATWRYYLNGGRTWVALPLDTTADNTIDNTSSVSNPALWKAVAISFEQSAIGTLKRQIQRRVLRHGVIVFVVASVLALILIRHFLPREKTHDGSHQSFFNVLLAILVMAHLAFTGLNIHLLSRIIASLPLQADAFRFSAGWGELMLGAGTVIMISAFMFSEMLIGFSHYVMPQPSRTVLSAVHYSLIRPVIFILMFGMEMSLSFVPLYMEALYQPVAGTSKEVILSLPVSVTVFFTGVAFLVAGGWSDRRGWQAPFFNGVALATGGLLYASLAPNAVHFIAARAVTGLGYGLFFMAAQGFIIMTTDQTTKASGFAALFAALYAGIICGNATGAMLVERIGYRPIFFIGALVVFSAIAYALLFMRTAFHRPSIKDTAVDARKDKKSALLRFIFNRNVVAVTLLSAIPANMAMIGFLNYFNPIYLNRIGASYTTIGRVFIIYGILIIYGGPLISRLVDASTNKKAFIVAGGVLGSIAFLSFLYFSGIAAAIAAVFLLGVSQSFVFVTQVAYLLKLETTQQLGQGLAVGTFRALNRLGQALGPLCFGGLIAGLPFREGVIWFGSVYLAITALFLVMAQRDADTVPEPERPDPDKPNPDKLE